MNGVVREDAAMTKGAAKPGDCVILTKPLGTGVILAGNMQGKAKGRWVAGIQNPSSELLHSYRLHHEMNFGV